MPTIRELGEKYGGLIQEFVSNCDQEGKDCETENSESPLFTELIETLQKGDLLTEKQTKYSCSDILYVEMRKKLKNEIFYLVDKGDLNKLERLVNDWSINEDNIDLGCFDIAFERGHFLTVQWLLKIFPRFNLTHDDDAPFLALCRNGSRPAIEWFISVCPQVDYFYGFSILCYSGHLDTAKWILTLRPSLKENFHPSLFADVCRGGYLEVAKWLIELRPDLDVHLWNNNAFISACRKGHLEMAEWLYENFPSVLNNAENALLCSCESGRLEVAQWLLSIKPDIDIDGDSNGFHLLTRTCSAGHLHVAKWLFSIKQDFNIRAWDDYCFRSVCEGGYLELAQWLYSVYPEIVIRSCGDEAFFYACTGGYLELAKWLLKMRPDIEIGNALLTSR